MATQCHIWFGIIVVLSNHNWPTTALWRMQHNLSCSQFFNDVFYDEYRWQGNCCLPPPGGRTQNIIYKRGKFRGAPTGCGSLLTSLSLLLSGEVVQKCVHHRESWRFDHSAIRTLILTIRGGYNNLSQSFFIRNYSECSCSTACTVLSILDIKKRQIVSLSTSVMDVSKGVLIFTLVCTLRPVSIITKVHFHILYSAYPICDNFDGFGERTEAFLNMKNKLNYPLCDSWIFLICNIYFRWITMTSKHRLWQFKLKVVDLFFFF